MKPPRQRDMEKGPDWPATVRAFLSLRYGRKEKIPFLTFLPLSTSGSFRFQFWSSPLYRYVFAFKWLFSLVCPVGVLS